MKSHVVAQFDGREPKMFFDRVQRLANLGVDSIQLRGPELPTAELFRAAVHCRKLIGQDTRFVVNRRYDVAIACEADGVHLPASGLPVSVVRAGAPDLVIGRSCHSVAECAQAAKEGADYVLLGPLFDTRSKTSAGRIPITALREAASLPIEVFALGGMTRQNMTVLSGTGTAGVAAITLFMKDEPLEEIVEEVRTL